VIESISSGVPVPIVIRAFIEDMSSGFNWVLPAWTLELFFREEM